VIVEPLEHLQLLGGLLVPLLRSRLHRVQPLLDRLQVFQQELCVDDLHVPRRIHGAGHVGHLLVLEAAHDVNNGVDLPDLGEKLVAQPFALGRPLHESGDVDELDAGGDRLRRPGQFGNAGEPVVGNRHDPHVRVDRTEGVVVGLGPGTAQRIEDGRLADIGEADEAALKRHWRTET